MVRHFAALSVLLTLSLCVGHASAGDDPPAPETAPPTTPVPAPPEAAPPDDGPPEPTPAPQQPLVLPPAEPAPAPAPGASPPPVPAPAVVPSELPAEEEPDLQLYGGILITGIGAGLFVLAGVAVSRIDTLQDDPGYVAYRRGFEPSLDVCEQAQSGTSVPGASSPEEVVELCDEASAWEITNYVAIPGGFALVGMGLYLSLTSDTAKKESPVAFAPILGPTHAGLTMSGRF